MNTPNDSPESFPNVHEIVTEAVQAAKVDESPMKPVSIRLPEDLKELTAQICAANGTDTSAFLRKCCEALVRDYLPGAPERT